MPASENKERPAARYIRPGEMLAIDPQALRAGPEAMFWLFGSSSPANRRHKVHADVAIVTVRGPLDHHSDSWGENYESIIDRVGAAMSGQDVCDAHRTAYLRKHWGDEEGYEPIEAEAPSAVLLCLDSPGGVVSGLNETVATLQKMRADSGVPLIAYVNEMAASAAYALACACDRILCPPSAIIGSVGVISTIASQAEADKKAGLDVRLITSGARKADGHAHAPITDAALDAEGGRVDKLAAAFFKIVSKSRGIPVKTIVGFQAGIYLGKDAERNGLADEVMRLDDAILALSAQAAAGTVGAGGNETKRRAAKKTVDVATETRSLSRELTLTSASVGESPMLKLVAERKKLEASIASEKDPKKLAALQATLEAYKKVEKHVEHTKSEEDDDPEDDDEDKDADDEEDDEEDEKKSAKSKSKGESEEEEEEEAKSEKDEKKAALGIVGQLKATLGVTDKQLPGALMAALEKVAKYDALAGDVAALKATQTKAARSALIDEAVAQRRITRGMAKDLRTKKLSFVEGFLAMHKSPLVNIDEEALEVPDQNATDADLSAASKKLVEQAVTTQGLTGDAADKFRQQAYADQRKANARATNGAGAH